MFKPAHQLKEQRQFGRRQSGAHAWVKVRGRPAIPCVLKNISDGGALLEFVAAEMLPYRFRVTIEAEGVDRDCEIRHQTGNRVGVEFVKTESHVTGGGRATAEDVADWTSPMGQSTRRPRT
jgi:hypothetical protein